MSTINAALLKLLDDQINISKSQISQGSKSHNYIRDLLKGKNSTDKEFPRLLDTDFLSGSYIRGTKPSPLDDVDVMIVIDGSGLCVTSSGYVQNVEVAGSETLDNPILQHLGEDRLLSSKTVMSLFKDALQKSHSSSSVRDDEQAVNVWLDSYNMGIDVVPCFHLKPRDGSQDYYYIPEGGASHGWKTTNPKIDQAISTRLNDKHGLLLKKVVRLLKFWNNVSNRGRLKSYHLETVAWHIFDARKESVKSLEEGLVAFFVGAETILSNPCQDKTLLGGPVDGYLTDLNRQLSIQRTKDACKVIYDAYVVDNGELESKKKAWQKVFSDNLEYS